MKRNIFYIIITCCIFMVSILNFNTLQYDKVSDFMLCSNIMQANANNSSELFPFLNNPNSSLPVSKYQANGSPCYLVTSRQTHTGGETTLSSGSSGTYSSGNNISFGYSTGPSGNIGGSINNSSSTSNGESETVKWHRIEEEKLIGFEKICVDTYVIRPGANYCRPISCQEMAYKLY